MTSKEAVLSLLEKNRGRYLSGETIAKQLHISRNAVWKAVSALRKDGYPVTAVTRRGYCLDAGADILSVQGMLPWLSAQGTDKNIRQGDNGSDAELRRKEAERIHVYDTVESTNETAKKMAVLGAPHGTLVIADHQTAGNGHRRRRFYSPPGGIYMSVILRRECFPLGNSVKMTQFGALSVSEAIEHTTGLRTEIKWINDLYLNKKKVCGILTESMSDSENGEMQWAVLGIGINFQGNAGMFPEEVRDRVGTLFPAGKAPVTRNQLAAEILNRVTDAGRAGEEEVIRRKYTERLMYLGREALLCREERKERVKVLGVNDRGELMVRFADGHSGEIPPGEAEIRG